MKEVFHNLYDKYHQDIFQFLFYMVKDRSLAEDLVQEVYVKVLKSYHKFKGDSSEKTWLISIARHVAIDYFRKQKRKQKKMIPSFTVEEKSDFIQDKGKMPDEIALENEDIRNMYQCLKNCSFDQQTVIILRYIQSLSIKETAEILNWSESKVKTTQHRAIKRLRKQMKKREEGIKHEGK
ncbi:RNA polymerase sigma-70 factor, ECF subfamily [Salinibacillus kushneri]|uniref:RNA polymerase sigma factor n=1 Tax=Salinibacillus kushneri TaxID=237682 RepID=A0A1I0HYH7_9BACI|nr:RNA polymerase sigma factor SigX [Salinibacillus kushneri]SET89268.1 RNA polymerase sigma-70 factor, ECF subfamily [Salinibacillus kushneri]